MINHKWLLADLILYPVLTNPMNNQVQSETKRMTKKQLKEQERQAAIRRLIGSEEWNFNIKPGDTLYTQVTHVSKSGMYRTIKVYVMKDNTPYDISHVVNEILGWGFSDIPDKKGIKVSGCGMDMGFHLVNSLSYALYPEYNCVGGNDYNGYFQSKCPSSDHVNSGPNKNVYDTQLKHKDGYALKQRWL